MEEITFNDSLEVHESWLKDVTQCMIQKYQTIQNMADHSTINGSSIFWFFRGCPVTNSDFESICNTLGFDSATVQRDKI